MQLVADVHRPNISESVATTLRQMIVEGQLEPGGRINEVHLAARLKISRTPLREALSRLVAEGALTSLPRLGFYVCPLTVEEFEQIYPIRALLDPAALQAAGLPSDKRLARLSALNRKLGETRDPEAAIALDDAWHLELLADCPNATLMGLIEQFIWRTRRYELALMRERRNLKRTVRHHGDILEALRRADLNGACAALKRNMESGKEPIIAWLKKQKPKSLRG
jgi:DNA-binding GntR family transcriptional regulator